MPKKKNYVRPNTLTILLKNKYFFIFKTKLHLYKTQKKTKWISITSWKIKHKQNNSKKIKLKNGMQNLWLRL
jgi:hypothetical protein